MNHVFQVCCQSGLQESTSLAATQRLAKASCSMVRVSRPKRRRKVHGSALQLSECMCQPLQPASHGRDTNDSPVFFAGEVKNSTSASIRSVEFHFIV